VPNFCGGGHVNKGAKDAVLYHDDRPAAYSRRSASTAQRGRRRTAAFEQIVREPGDVVSAAHCHFDRRPERIGPEIALKARGRDRRAEHPARAGRAATSIEHLPQAAGIGAPVSRWGGGCTALAREHSRRVG